MRLGGRVSVRDLAGQVVAGDIFGVAKYLPSAFVDLLILDPPYNIAKEFNRRTSGRRPADEYRRWFQELVDLVVPTMKPDATLYVCSDWSTSAVIFPVLKASFQVRNRITWERDKGRGAKTNWKNNAEDIWFCTRLDEYYFNVDAVKLKRRVLATPTARTGCRRTGPRSQMASSRLTHPSNIWTDITVPFWSNAGEHRPSGSEAGKTDREANSGELETGRLGCSTRSSAVGRPRSLQKSSRAVGAASRSMPSTSAWHSSDSPPPRTDPSIQGYADGVFWERKHSSRPHA